MSPLRSFANPAARRRLAVGTIVIAALAAGIGHVLRNELERGSGRHSTTYLLDTAGWLLAVAGAVVEARASDLFFSFAPKAARRRAVAFLVIGLVVGLTGCVVVSASGGPALVGAVGSAGLVGGAGLGLAGGFTLAWVYGGRYAADRIHDLGDEEW